MVKYYYIYVLRSRKDKNFYTGYTENIKIRVEEHNKGLVHSTKNRTPLDLVYFEGCLNQKDATRREKYLKTTYGKRFIRNRIKNDLSNTP
jgi:putative endonuclease